MKIKILLLIFLSLLSSWRFFRPGYFSMQDDIQVFRLQQFDQCLRDKQIPCRYISDGGLGFGYPLFNFYSPLPYLISENAHLLGFSYINSIKIAFIIPSFVRTFGMYLLVSAFFGSTGGFLGAALYALAPYQAVNSFVRGAIGENWALSLLPLVFWSLYKQKTKLSVVFFCSLLLSHNLTLIYALPLLAIFSIFTKKFKYFFRTLLWSIALCAFFLIPAYFEKKLTTVDTMTQGFFSFIIHFATLKELFVSNFWGYSGSMWGPVDGLSFNIGTLQWLIPVIVSIYYLFKTSFKHRYLVLLFFIVGLFGIYLTHNKSTFIWNSLSFMAYFQFPWRFLGLSIFCFAFVSGGLANLFKKSTRLPVIVGLLFISIAINYSYFKEDIWYSNLTDNQKLSGPELIRQSGAGLMDYWPKYSTKFPDTYAPALPVVVEGEVDFIKYYKNSYFSEAYFSVSTQNALVNLPIVYFPNWSLVMDGNKTNYKIDKELGLIQLELTQGQHHYELSFKNTPIRTFANLFSLFALGSFIILIIREKRK